MREYDQSDRPLGETQNSFELSRRDGDVDRFRITGHGALLNDALVGLAGGAMNSHLLIWVNDPRKD
jgi:hypothetical protein